VSAIHAVHEADRKAHLRQDARDLASRIAPRLISVGRGKVTIQTPDDVCARFESYFRGITHTVWEDVEPPIIRISLARDFAYAVYKVHSHYVPASQGDGREETDFVSAWTSTYELIGGEWKMTSVTSTFEAPKPVTHPPDSFAPTPRT